MRRIATNSLKNMPPSPPENGANFSKTEESPLEVSDFDDVIKKADQQLIEANLFSASRAGPKKSMSVFTKPFHLRAKSSR